MRNWVRVGSAVGSLVVYSLTAAPASAQDKAAEAARKLAEAPAQESSPATKSAVDPADYGQWESLRAPLLSPDGKWLASPISRVDESVELRLRMLATEATEAIENADRAAFSADSNWLAYRIGPPPAERKKLSKDGEPVEYGMVLRSLTDGQKTEFENVQSFSFRDDGAYLLMHRAGPEGGSGADLVLRDLASGVQTSFGNVSRSTWNDDGTLLAMVIDTHDDAGNGVQVYDTASGVLRTLDSSDSDYALLNWREDSHDLAVLREHEHEDDEDATHTVLCWKGLRGKRGTSHEFDPTEAEGFPDMRLVSMGGLSWSEDGAALFFGVKEWEHKPAALTADADSEESAEDDGAEEEEAEEEAAGSEDAEEGGEAAEGKALRDRLEEPSGVEIWHARDIDIQPLQKKRAPGVQRESHRSVWWIEDDRFVQLGSELTEVVAVMSEGRLVIGSDNTPYEREKMFGPTVYDRYVIDMKTGEAAKFLDRNKYMLGADPGGRFVAYVKDDQIWCYDTKAGAHRDLTSSLGSDFINHTLSNLTDEKPPYGVAGWGEKHADVYLYDRWDLWRVALDGRGAERLTDGAAEHVRHRVQELDPDRRGEIERGEDLLLTVYGDRSKESGFARLTGGKVKQLRYLDLNAARMVKAADADVFAWVEQDFDDSPDVFVAGPELEDPRQVTETNPFQADYLWGTSELVDYVSDRGEDLQGALFYPAGYEAGEQYPMIVYIYELRSQVVHSYSNPTERHPYNPAVFTAEGYFVYQPDITYRAQNPGLSAKECVVPAVKQLLERGMIDPERVGLIGHSWGGYQTAFLSTTTDVFAACVAGAPLTNMMSMSMSIYWNSGQTDAWIFHESQGRMDRPFWRDIDTYARNSAIFNLDTMQTPLLMAFGDEDGAVDWHQGVEFYNAARLAEKDFVLLVYPGENHSNAKEENQVDYHYRVLEWFGHYLKGEEAKPWITEGKSHLDRQKELEELKKK